MRLKIDEKSERLWLLMKIIGGSEAVAYDCGRCKRKEARWVGGGVK